MATKLIGLRLTSVDLVRAGANQEADICLYKSLDGAPQEEPQTSPQEEQRTISKSDPDRFDTICEVEKFNPFHDARGRFSNKHGFSTYSANPKMKVAQPSIARSAQAGHGKTMNVHRESKGENINENYDWMQGKKPAAPAAPAAPPTKPAAPAKPAKPAKPKPQQDDDADTKPKSSDADVASGKAANAVDGKDLTGKFQYNDSSSDYAIEQIIKAQGFDGKPTVTKDPAAFADACKASNFIAKRGVGASDQATMDAYDEALKTGEFYVKCSGGSVHGYGMYAASVAANGRRASTGISDAEWTAKAYANGNASQKIYTFTMDKSAKIGTESSLSRMMANDTEYAKVCNSSKMNQRYTMDVGCYAAYKGYDGYLAGGGRNYNYKDGSESQYTVILNRSKVIIFDGE